MWQLRIYNESGKWFSTARIQAYYESDYSVCQKITEEIQANLKHWQQSVTWEVFHNNQNVTGWYLSVLKDNES